jgi:hypothetical protein
MDTPGPEKRRTGSVRVDRVSVYFNEGPRPEKRVTVISAHSAKARRKESPSEGEEEPRAAGAEPLS